MDRLALYPAKHFVTPEPRLQVALEAIRQELEERLAELRAEGKLLEAQRLRQRTEYDLELLGTHRHLPRRRELLAPSLRPWAGRAAGLPDRLLPRHADDSADFLLIIDESHVTVPQVGGMYEGDRSRKQVLVDFGFRLPSALDNRPLRQDEFEALTGSTIYVSATPAPVRARAVARRGRGADHPPDRTRRSRDRDQADRAPGRRSARRDPRAGGAHASACW